VQTQEQEQAEGVMLGTVRKKLLTRPLFKWAKGVLPGMSATEREALDAGDVWWDAALFSGDPDWKTLQNVPKPELSAEERAFIDGPVDELCAMIDDWRISWEDGDLPDEVWRFMKEKGFFGMIIPKAYGGLEFSAWAQSEVVRRISTRSADAAVTVMVPNSLGPGELLMEFGTDEQRDYWLPRLADGREVPCFGLTSPEAGSDAASMEDTGVVCRGRFQGEEVLGIRLNWHKRYITLGPVATVLGLAFKLKDPDGLLGGAMDLGITVALVPTDLDGVEIGRRHLPSHQMFQNGPNKGHDVFIPIDHIIGGADNAGKGWQMLMSALAAGRGISLPSLSAAGAAFCARTTGAYARIREQFGIPIGRFEGVQDRLARLAGHAYQLDAARRLTCAGLDQGHQPAVISAIMKAHATYRLREAVDDAMDVHAGKAVIDGPLNYLGNLYRAVPVAITVEGANILTRNLIIFGQGAIRCHPWLLKEMLALEQNDREAALDEFDKAFWGHVGHSLRTLGRAWSRSWLGLRPSRAPDAPATRGHYRRLSRYAAALALASDLALLTMGGALKRKEMISARLGDVLSELYLLSGALKRFEDEGSPEADRPVLDYCMASGFRTIETRLDEVFRNFPNRFAAGFLRFVIMPRGVRAHGPDDRLIGRCAALLLEPGETRDRLTEGVYLGAPGEDRGVARLEKAYALVNEAASAEKKLREAKEPDWQKGQRKGVLSEEEAELVRRAREAVAAAIAVDDFAPDAFRRSGEDAPDRDPADQPLRLVGGAGSGGLA
jgi:acyl-CoA dehydrogenase